MQLILNSDDQTVRYSSEIRCLSGRLLWCGIPISRVRIYFWTAGWLWKFFYLRLVFILY